MTQPLNEAPPLSAKQTLRALLPTLGYTLSDDFAEVWNGLLFDARRIVPQPTSDDMRSVVAAWGKWIETLRAENRPGSSEECGRVVRKALAR